MCVIVDFTRVCRSVNHVKFDRTTLHDDLCAYALTRPRDKFRSFVPGHEAVDGVNEYVSWGDNFDLITTSISGFVWGWANSLNEYIPWIDKLSGNGNYRLHSGANGRINFGIRNLKEFRHEKCG